MLVIGTSFYSVPTLFLGFYIINFIQLGANCVLMCFDFEPKLMFVWRQKRQSADNKQGRVISDAGEGLYSRTQHCRCSQRQGWVF